MNFIKERMVNGFDGLLTRLLIKRFGLLQSEENKKSVCSDLNLLAAYLEHNLTADQMREIEGHMVECRLCRKTIVNAFNSLKIISDPALSAVKKS